MLPIIIFVLLKNDFLPVAGTSPALTHEDKYKKAQEHIESLNGKKIKVGSGREEIEWKVVPGVFQDDMADTIRAEMEAFEKNRLKFVDEFPNKFDLLLKMWPGDFWDDFHKLNQYIEERNIERKKTATESVSRGIKARVHYISYALHSCFTMC